MTIDCFWAGGIDCTSFVVLLLLGRNWVDEKETTDWREEKCGICIFLLFSIIRKTECSALSYWKVTTIDLQGPWQIIKGRNMTIDCNCILTFFIWFSMGAFMGYTNWVGEWHWRTVHYKNSFRGRKGRDERWRLPDCRRFHFDGVQ